MTGLSIFDFLYSILLELDNMAHIIEISVMGSAFNQIMNKNIKYLDTSLSH